MIFREREKEGNSVEVYLAVEHIELVGRIVRVVLERIGSVALVAGHIGLAVPAVHTERLVVDKLVHMVAVHMVAVQDKVQEVDYCCMLEVEHQDTTLL